MNSQIFHSRCIATQVFWRRNATIITQLGYTIDIIDALRVYNIYGYTHTHNDGMYRTLNYMYVCCVHDTNVYGLLSYLLTTIMAQAESFVILNSITKKQFAVRAVEAVLHLLRGR